MPRSIAFAFVATHNHFVFDRGGKVFNRSAPVIKLPADATDDDHLALLGLLNSSTACFWMKQVFFPKGGDQVGSEGARIRKTWWDERFEFAGTGLQSFPLAKQYPQELSKKLDELSSELGLVSPEKLLQENSVGLIKRLSEGKEIWEVIRLLMVSLQEELDWQCYQLYNLIGENLTYQGELPSLQLGQRAFEIVMARKIGAGELVITWFERHNSTPITELPADWSDEYKKLVQRRIEIIESNPNIAILYHVRYEVYS